MNFQMVRWWTNGSQWCLTLLKHLWRYRIWYMSGVIHDPILSVLNFLDAWYPFRFMRSYRKKDILLIMSVFLLRMKSPPKKEILMIWSVTISANWKLPTCCMSLPIPTVAIFYCCYCLDYSWPSFISRAQCCLINDFNEYLFFYESRCKLFFQARVLVPNRNETV